MEISSVTLPVLLAWHFEVEATTHKHAALVTTLSNSNARLCTIWLNYLTVLGMVLSTKADLPDLKLYT